MTLYLPMMSWFSDCNPLKPISLAQIPKLVFGILILNSIFFLICLLNLVNCCRQVDTPAKVFFFFFLQKVYLRLISIHYIRIRKTSKMTLLWKVLGKGSASEGRNRFCIYKSRLEGTGGQLERKIYAFHPEELMSLYYVC